MYEIKVKEHTKKKKNVEKKVKEKRTEEDYKTNYTYLNSKLLSMILLIDNFGWSFCS